MLFEPLRSHLEAIQNRHFELLRKPVGDSIVDWLRKVTPNVEFNCSLSEEDRKLICYWSNTSKYAEIPESIVKRLESARKSELATIIYYRKLGSKVQDVSIGQAIGNPLYQNDWKTHDLVVDGKPLDVKSTRRTFRGIESVEYFINKTKRDKTNYEIGYTGVTSKVVKDGVVGSSIVTGECHLSELTALKNCCAELYPNFFEFSGGWSKRIPVWMFEFPDIHYGSEFFDLKNAFQARPEFASVGGPALQVMLALSAFYPGNTQAVAQRQLEKVYLEELTDEQRRFVCELGKVVKRVNLSRRSLYLFLLVYALRLVKKNPGFHLDSLRRLLFLSTSMAARSFPLGLYDPLNCVWDLITIFSRLLKYNRNLLLRMSRFRMYSTAILRGCIDGDFRTILAYCGNCGKQPIYLGKSRSCERCGYLICDNCQFCSDHCGTHQSMYLC